MTCKEVDILHPIYAIQVECDEEVSWLHLDESSYRPFYGSSYMFLVRHDIGELAKSILCRKLITDVDSSKAVITNTELIWPEPLFLETEYIDYLNPASTDMPNTVYLYSSKYAEGFPGTEFAQINLCREASILEEVWLDFSDPRELLNL